MPLKVHDTDKLKSAPRAKAKSAPAGPVQDVRVAYGIDQKAKLNTAAEQTDRQEYDRDGLQRTTKYTVDKTSKR